MKRRILIVDDNATLAYFSARNLQRDLAKVEVATAVSSAQALTDADRFQPDVVVADLFLSDGNGLDVIAQMKTRFPGLRAILISGEEPPKDKTDGLFGFLVKPYEAWELADIVGRALAGAPLRAEEAESENVREASIDVRIYDRHAIRNRLAGLLTGLRAFGADIRACSHDRDSVERVVNEYLDRLCASVMEVSSMLPKTPQPPPKSIPQDLNPTGELHSEDSNGAPQDERLKAATNKDGSGKARGPVTGRVTGEGNTLREGRIYRDGHSAGSRRTRRRSR